MLADLFLQNNTGAPFRPVADAGDDLTVAAGGAVSLRGTATGPWGDRVTWEWVQVDGAGSDTAVTGTAAVALTGASAARATFTAPSAATVLHLRLVADPVPGPDAARGRAAGAADWVTVTASDDTPPTVDAAASGHHADPGLTTALTGTRGSGTDIHIKVRFSEHVVHTAGDGAAARPEILRRVGEDAAVQFDIVADGTALASGDCRRRIAGDSSEYHCLHIAGANDSGAFTFEVGTGTQDTAGNALAGRYVHADTLTLVPGSIPTVANPIPDQSAGAGAAFRYQFPEGTFTDADGDELAHTATRSDGTALPAWLGFDGAARTFEGTPAAEDAGTLRVRVTADDGNGGTADDIFDIRVAGTDVCGRTPEVRDAIVDAVPGVGDCAGLTPAHLAGITGLNLVSEGIGSLKAGDFAGLGGLTELRLDRNSLTELPANLFDGLAALTVLSIFSNSLAALPDDVFGNLAALTELYLNGNPGAPFRPVAEAGPDRKVQTGARATLLGSATGPWGERVSWEWTQVDGANSDTAVTAADAVALDGATGATPAFTAPSAEATLHLRLIASPKPAPDTARGTAASVADRAEVTASDDTAPTVVSIGRLTPASSPTNADMLTWRVTFSGAVSNVDAADFAVSGTTGTVSAVAAVEGTNAHDVTVSGGDLAGLDGTVTLSFAAAQDITDSAGTALSNTVPTGANDNDYEVDNTAPTVEITGVPEESSAAFTATFTFPEAVNGFAPGDIEVGNGAASEFTGTDGDTVYTALITPAADGAVTVDVAADVAEDLAGNGNAAAQAASTHTATGPTVVSIERLTPASSPTNADMLTWRVTFSGAVSNVDAADFAVSGTTGTVAEVAAVEGTNAHDVTVSGGDLAGLDATVMLSFAAGRDIADGDGNVLSNTAPPGTDESTYAVDNTAPTVMSAAAEGLTVTVTWSEAIDPASGRSDAGGSTLRGSVGRAGGAVAVDGTDGTKMRLTMDAAIPDGTQDATLAWAPPDAGVPVRDAAGNPAAAFTGRAVGVTPDTSAPTLTGAVVRGAVLGLTFSEPLDGASRPAADRFTVTVTRDADAVAGHTVSAVEVAGTGVRLTLAKGVLPNDAVVLSYAPPATDPLRDLAATPNDVAAFTTGRNNGTYDVPAVDNRTAVLEVAFTKASVTEGDDRTVVLGVTVAGGGTAGADRRIAVAVSGTPTALGTEDWTLGTGSLTLAAGARSVAFPVTVVDDARLETGESVAFAVTADGAAIGSATLSVADDDRAVLRVVGPEDAVEEGGTDFTLRLRLDPHPDNGPTVADDACFLDFAVAATLSVTENGSELSGTPALPLDADFPATSFSDCTREVTAQLSTRASDGEWAPPRTVAFSLEPKGGADPRVDGGEGSVAVRDDTRPPGPVVTDINISSDPPLQATSDYEPSRNREEFKEVPDGAVHGPGTELTFTLTFDHRVTVAGGSPELVLDVFGRERRAVLPEDADLTDTLTLEFRWTVAEGDNDPDGIAIVRIEPGGATIRFAADCQMNCVLDLPTFVRDHGGRRAEHRVRGGFHTIALDAEGMAKTVNEGEQYRVQARRDGGAFDEHALATVWMTDSALEGGSLIGVPFRPAGTQGIGREPTDGSTAWLEVPVPGDGREDGERTLTFRLSGTDSGRNWYDPPADRDVTVVVKVTEADIPKDGPKFSVGPAIGHEPATGEAPLRFRICLWTGTGCPLAPGQDSDFDAYGGVGHEVSVDYATRDGTATEGADCRETSGRLTFAPGETAKTVEVPMLADAHDEGVETVWLELSNPAGAGIARGRNVGDIRNDGPIPQAWIARFGRTVAEQVLDAVEGRMRASRTPGIEVSLAGERIIGAGADPGDGQGAQRLADRLEGGTTGSWNGPGGDGERRWRAVAPHELLTGSSFAMTAETADRGLVSFWGRAAAGRFDGREGGLSLDGEVETGMLGADWSRGSGAGSWTAGLIVSHSTGTGAWSGGRAAPDGAPGISGGVEASLTGVFPWARLGLTDRLEAWGTAGHGAGGLTVTPDIPGTGERGAAIRTDLDLWMAAIGLRGTLLEPESGSGAGGFRDGLTLTVKSDAMVVRTASGRGRGTDGGNLEPARATVSRLRLGLEASRPVALGDAVLTPSLEVGLRHDGGDAETGFGIDLGGGLALSDPARGLQAEIRGRGLLSHGSKGFRNRGVSVELSWRQRPDSDRGATLALTRSVGGASSGGADALLSRATMDGLSAGDRGPVSGDDDPGSRRLAVRLGYGFRAFGDRYTWTPETGVGLTDTGREYSLGWRLVRRPGHRDAGSLKLSFEGRRRESLNDDRPATHEVGLRLTRRW